MEDATPRVNLTPKRISFARALMDAEARQVELQEKLNEVLLRLDTLTEAVFTVVTGRRLGGA